MTSRKHPMWRAGRWVLAALWLVAALLTLWTAPREASYERAVGDVSDRAVLSYQWGESWRWTDDGWFGDISVRRGQHVGPIFLWRTGDGRVHWADTSGFGPRDENSAVADPGTAVVVQKLADGGLADRLGELTPYSAVVSAIGLVLGAVFLGVVVAGPAPVLGTRWYWFWLVIFAPYGLGLVFWLFRDRPWADPAAGGVGSVAGPGRRDRGWFGAVTGILASLAVSLLVGVASWALGGSWVPRPFG